MIRLAGSCFVAASIQLAVWSKRTRGGCSYHIILDERYACSHFMSCSEVRLPHLQCAEYTWKKTGCLVVQRYDTRLGMHAFISHDQ